MKNEKVKLVIKALLYLIGKLVKFIYNIFAFFGGVWFVLLFSCLGDVSGEMIAGSDLIYLFESLMVFSVSMAMIATVVNKIINKEVKVWRD